MKSEDDELKGKSKALRARLSRLSEANLRNDEKLDFDHVVREVLESALALTETRYGMTTVPDEFSRACLAIPAALSIRSADVIEASAELMVFRGAPDHIRADNRPEFRSRAVHEWPGRVRARTLCIEPGSSWENGLRVLTGGSGTSCWTGSSSIRCWMCVC